MNNTYHVKLVSREIWEPLTKAQLNLLPFKARNAARSIIRTMHNRHVGITPELATQLALLILDPTSAAQADVPWANVLSRLVKELETQPHKTSKNHGFGLLLSAVPPYSIIRLAMPVIEQACKQIKLCCLFCEDESGSTSVEEFNKYTQRLAREIAGMADEKNDFMQIFWQERALAIANYSRRPGMWEQKTSGLPETHPTASAMMLRLKPKVQPIKPIAHSPIPASSRMKHRESLKNKEGGFSGIRITRRPEDMEDILMSEFLNPPVLLIDRMVNSGYLALKRKPKHEKLRDVLIAGLVPHDVKPQLNADFIKSCWFDFVARMSMMLCRHRLINSEFRWLEGDAMGRSRNSSFLLEDLPVPEAPAEHDLTRAFRQGFMTALGWIPNYLDNRNGFKTVPERKTGETDPMLQWACSAWKGQALHRGIYEEGKPIPASLAHRKIAVDTFAFVHVMLFLPAGNENNTGTPPHVRLAQLQKGLGLAGTSGCSVSITHVPDSLENTSQWAVDRAKKRDSRLFPAEQPKLSWEEIAGRLEQVWLEHLVEEIWNG